MTPTTPRIVRLAEVELQMGPDGIGNNVRVTHKWRKDFRLARMFFSYVHWATPGLWTDALYPLGSLGYLTTDGKQPVFVPSLALMGAGRRWLPLGVSVKGGDIWTIDLRVNFDAIPYLLFDVEDATRAAAA